MMKQQLFTQAGVNAKLAELAALSADERFIETNRLTTDFRGWISDHFRLNGKQGHYLEQMDERSTRLAGAQLYTAINAGLTVNVIVPIHPVKMSSKYICISTCIETRDDGNGNFTASGEVSITFQYLPITEGKLAKDLSFSVI